jgi:hypothetical protein
LNGEGEPYEYDPAAGGWVDPNGHPVAGIYQPDAEIHWDEEYADGFPPTDALGNFVIRDASGDLVGLDMATGYVYPVTDHGWPLGPDGEPWPDDDGDGTPEMPPAYHQIDSDMAGRLLDPHGNLVEFPSDFAPDGTPLGPDGTPLVPGEGEDQWLDEEGNPYYTTIPDGAVFISEDGRPLYVTRSTLGPDGPYVFENGMPYPVDVDGRPIFVDADGNLYAVDPASGETDPVDSLGQPVDEADDEDAGDEDAGDDAAGDDVEDPSAAPDPAGEDTDTPLDAGTEAEVDEDAAEDQPADEPGPVEDVAPGEEEPFEADPLEPPPDDGLAPPEDTEPEPEPAAEADPLVEPTLDPLEGIE